MLTHLKEDKIKIKATNSSFKYYALCSNITEIGPILQDYGNYQVKNSYSDVYWLWVN